MRIGPMRHRLELQVLSETQDQLGQMIPTFTTVATIWGHIEPLRAYESINANQLGKMITHKITTRYFPGLATTSRFVYASRAFNINGVVNVGEMNREYEITCIEVGNS